MPRAIRHITEREAVVINLRGLYQGRSIYLSPTNDLSTDQKHTATRTKLRSLAFTASFCFVLALLPIVVFLSTPKKWTMLTLALVGLMLLLYPIYRGVRSGSLDIFEPPVMTALL